MAGCGSVTYLLTPAHSFITVNVTAPKITVDATTASQVGIYSISLTGSLDLYPTLAPLTV